MHRPRGMPRRQFICFGLAGGVLLPSVLFGAGTPALELQWLQVADDGAAPVAGRGDWLAVDAGARAFGGDGLYLYPAWGTPRPYLVRVAAGAGGRARQHEFCNPATGAVLWTDSGIPVFAGRIQGRLPPQIGAWLGHMPELQLLQVPRLPA